MLGTPFSTNAVSHVGSTIGAASARLTPAGTPATGS